jgi:hypothetical protein
MPVLSAETAHGFFRPLLNRLGEHQRAPLFAPDDVRDLLFTCDTGAAVLDRLHVSLQVCLGRGIEGGKLAFVLKEFADVIELALNEVYPKLRSITADGALPEGERLAGLDTLDHFREHAVALRTELISLQQWVETPPPRVDLVVVSQRGAAEARECETSEEILRRLAAGGQL